MVRTVHQLVEFQWQADENRLKFMQAQLALCFTFVSLAHTYYRAHNLEATERLYAHVQKGYSTMLHFMSDPIYCERFVHQARQGLIAGMDELWEMLAELQSLPGLAVSPPRRTFVNSDLETVVCGKEWATDIR